MRYVPPADVALPLTGAAVEAVHHKVAPSKTLTFLPELRSPAVSPSAGSPCLMWLNHRNLYPHRYQNCQDQSDHGYGAMAQHRSPPLCE